MFSDTKKWRSTTIHRIMKNHMQDPQPSHHRTKATPPTLRSCQWPSRPHKVAVISPSTASTRQGGAYDRQSQARLRCMLAMTSSLVMVVLRRGPRKWTGFHHYFSKEWLEFERRWLGLSLGLGELGRRGWSDSGESTGVAYLKIPSC
jgi:hypothetical protein